MIRSLGHGTEILVAGVRALRYGVVWVVKHALELQENQQHHDIIHSHQTKSL
jgi:hypothetical protein